MTSEFKPHIYPPGGSPSLKGIQRRTKGFLALRLLLIKENKLVLGHGLQRFVAKQATEQTAPCGQMFFEIELVVF